jgi:hypothetical protein
MLRVALKGFEGAYQRFLSGTTSGGSPEDAFVLLSEALWWTVSVDEGFKDLTGSIGNYPADVQTYVRTRNGDQFGRVFLGLEYARNRCGHQRVIVAVEEGLRIPFTLPMTIGNFFRWRPSSQLPPPPPRYPNIKLRQVYDDLLAGRPVSEALQSMHNWFAQEQHRAGILDVTV